MKVTLNGKSLDKNFNNAKALIDFLKTKNYIGMKVNQYHYPIFCKDFPYYYNIMSLLKSHGNVALVKKMLEIYIDTYDNQIKCFVCFETLEEYIKWLQGITPEKY